MNKTTPGWQDLDEFWVVGDFVAKVFMGWGGERYRRYINLGDPLRAEKFSSYRVAQKFIKQDKDAAEWVKENGGPSSVKPLRCRKSVVVYPPGMRP